MTARSALTPQMAAYMDKFADSGDIRWMPYLMYFHPASHRSPVVNTDSVGFRYSQASGLTYSVADLGDCPAVRVLAGSSTVFGIGASADKWTLPSRLGENDKRPELWLNYGGRSFNSTQELLLLTLYRHLLPQVKEIVLFSGFNNLGLARLPASLRGDSGAFFNCRDFFDALSARDKRQQGGVLGLAKRLVGADEAREDDVAEMTLEQQIDYASELTLRHLATWNSVARDMRAKLTFVLQPLSGWVRPTGSKEEEALFTELDQAGRFTETYGDILTREVCLEYGRALERGARAVGVGFLNMAPILAERLKPSDWLFVDRIHFTDWGHDFVAKTLLEALQTQGDFL
jgi:hypothetical protein